MMDYHGVHFLRFTSRLAALTALVADREFARDYFRHNLGNLTYPLEELSALPSVLRSLIDQRNGLAYSAGKLSLDVAVSPRTLLELNALLREPLFRFVEHPLTVEGEEYRQYERTVAEQKATAIQYLRERRARYASLAALRQSDEFLRSYGIIDA